MSQPALDDAPTFRILIIDDHPLMRSAMRSALETVFEQARVYVVGALEDAFRHLDRSQPPDLVLLDLNLPDACGTATIGAFRRRAPGIRVVAISGDDDDATVQACRAAGAAGFIPKRIDARHFAEVVRGVLAGRAVFPAGFGSPATLFGHRSPGRADGDDPIGRARGVLEEPPALPPHGEPKPASRFAAVLAPPRSAHREYSDGRHLGLTERQRGVLKLMLLGLPNKAICRELSLAEGTVKVHVSAVLRALGVATRAQAVVAAVRSGIRIDDEPR